MSIIFNRIFEAKLQKKFFYGASLILALFLFLAPHVVGASVEKSAWDYRIAITIDDTKVDADLTDFPVYVDLSTMPSSFFDAIKSDGGDIRVLAADGVTELPHEVFSVDPTNETGELYFLAPSVSSSSDSTFYIYYGNTQANSYSPTHTYGRNAVWDDYIRVYHGSSTDSSGNQDAILTGVTVGTTAKLGTAGFNFPANLNSQEISAGSVQGRTIQGWVRDTDTDGYAGYFVDTRSGLSTGYLYLNHPSGNPTLDVGSDFTAYLNGDLAGSGHGVGTTTFNSWNFLVARTASQWTDNPVHFGNRYSRGYQLDAFVGQMDELRITKTRDLSAAWIKADYNNQSSPATFYSVGSPE